MIAAESVAARSWRKIKIIESERYTERSKTANSAPKFVQQNHVRATRPSL
jgi:hypothetical protein